MGAGAGSAGVASSTSVTVSVVVPSIACSVAVMVVVPTARLMARPGLVLPAVCIAAIASWLLAQETKLLIFNILPSS